MTIRPAPTLGLVVLLGLLLTPGAWANPVPISGTPFEYVGPGVLEYDQVQGLYRTTVGGTEVSLDVWKAGEEGAGSLQQLLDTYPDLQPVAPDTYAWDSPGGGEVSLYFRAVTVGSRDYFVTAFVAAQAALRTSAAAKTYLDAVRPTAETAPFTSTFYLDAGGLEGFEFQSRENLVYRFEGHQREGSDHAVELVVLRTQLNPGEAVTIPNVIEQVANPTNAKRTVQNKGLWDKVLNGTKRYTLEWDYSEDGVMYYTRTQMFQQGRWLYTFTIRLAEDYENSFFFQSASDVLDGLKPLP